MKWWNGKFPGGDVEEQHLSPFLKEKKANNELFKLLEMSMYIVAAKYILLRHYFNVINCQPPNWQPGNS